MINEDEIFYIEQGDRSPSISAQLTDEDDNPIDLTNADVRFIMAEARGGKELVDDSVSVTDAANGKVRKVWDEGDTSEYGRFRAEFVVTYPDGAEESFPNVGYHNIVITRSLDA